MNDLAAPHVAQRTEDVQSLLGVKGESLKKWPAYSPDLNPIANFWSIMKHEINQNDKQSTTEKTLQKAMQDSAKAALLSTIKPPTESTEFLRASNKIVHTQNISDKVKASVNQLSIYFFVQQYLCVTYVIQNNCS